MASPRGKLSRLLFLPFVVSLVSSRKVPTRSEYFFALSPIDDGRPLNFSHKQPLIPWHCAALCLNNPDNCKGWRMVNGKCEMSDNTDSRETAPGLYVRSDGCDTVKCQNGGTCESTLPTIQTKRGYRCSCKCGTCGQLCERMNFVKIPNKGISQNNIAEKKLDNEEECMKECLQDSECKSVDFSTKDKICFINAANHLSPGVQLLPYRHVHFFYANCSGIC